MAAPAKEPVWLGFASWERIALFLLLAVTALRLAYLAVAPFDLSGDEAYYWDWGRQPAAGYYSKPPLIGWLMTGVRLAGWDSAFGIKAVAVVLVSISLALLYLLARAWGGPQAGLWALALALTTPANAMLSMFLTIDAPLVLCWTGALLALWLWQEDPRRTGALVGLALALALGSAAKQMMLVFPLLAVAMLVSDPERRERLRRPGLWLAFLAAPAALIPPLWWNASHNWITLQHTGHHFEGADRGTILDVFGRLGFFVGTQVGMLGGVTAVLMVLAVWHLYRGRRSGGGQARISHKTSTASAPPLRGADVASSATLQGLDRVTRFALWFSLPGPLLMLAMTLRQVVQANWAAVFYIAAFAWLGCRMATACDPKSGPLSFPLARRWRRAAVGCGLVLTLVLYALPGLVAVSGLVGHPRLDPLTRVRGWEQFGSEAGRFLEQTPAPANTPVIALGHRHNASQLAFYMPQRPRVYRWQRDGSVQSQYEIWPGPEEIVGRDALLVFPDENQTPGRLVRAFSEFEELGRIDVRFGERPGRGYRVYLGRELLAWPEPQP